MPISITVRKKIEEMDKLLLKLAEKIIKKLGSVVVRVESFDGYDGSNVRVVVREKSDAVFDAVFDAVAEVERETGRFGEIIVDIVDLEEARMQVVGNVLIDERALNMLKEKLEKKLGSVVVRVESFDGYDGSNVRVVVREKSDAVFDAVFDAVAEVERETGRFGEIIVDIVDLDEL
ncbi:MAG: hypothetical protein ACP6IP_09890 [Candidatus Njordarchaeia archaeon]